VRWVHVEFICWVEPRVAAAAVHGDGVSVVVFAYRGHATGPQFSGPKSVFFIPPRDYLFIFHVWRIPG